MAQMTDFFGVPHPHRHPPRDWIRGNQRVTFEEDPTINQIPQNQPPTKMVNQGVGVEPPRVEPQIPREREPRIVMVNRNQHVDNVIRQILHDDMAADNNLAAMVERIMVQNGVNFGLQRPNYTLPLSEYILQTETFPRIKIPKLTKFYGDTTESTVEHVA